MKKLLCLLLLSSACAGLRLRLVDAGVRKPSNVAVYFTVDTMQGEPVPGLSENQLHIYEDGRLVSPFEAKQTILNPQVATLHYTLLLVDMSGSVTGSGSLPALQDAVAHFTERVGPYQQTAIYAFDGRPEIFKLAGFSASPKVSALGSFKSKDPSTNLNGAIIEATKVLQKQIDHAPVPLALGTLVVFTDGSDHAARVTHRDLMRQLDDVDFSLLVIGVGGEIDVNELSAIGRDGAALSKDPASMSKSFDLVAARVEGYSKRFYLLSYCSPARAEEHDLTVEAVNPDGASGTLTYHFSAEGFGPECDPTKPPAFDVRHPKLRKGIHPVGS